MYQYEPVRFVWDCKIKSKGCLFLRQAEISEREREHRSLTIYIVELANEGHGEHRASCEARDGAH